MENKLLQEAKALYRDRIRIVLSALIIVFSLTFFLYYTSGLAGLEPAGSPYSGWTRAIQVVASFNNFGLIVAVGLLVVVFKFWSWAFLPGPASLYTLSILRGILGSKAVVKQAIGKRFRVTLENGMSFGVSCQIKEKGTEDWFSYRLVSSVIQHSDLRNIALRHGFSTRENKIVASVSNDELHHRTLLLTKALMIAAPVV
ncbi:MAG: hypothetical protein ACXABH_11335 [Candidatus Thorarchaeota archaeon]|jgi:hypothetical protein